MINASFDTSNSALHELLARADNGEPDQRRFGLLVSSGFNPPLPGQASRRGCTPYLPRWHTRVGENCYEQRALAEWKLGSRSRQGEAVHHANSDPEVNHPDNLWIFRSQRAHMLFEHYRNREARGGSSVRVRRAP